MAVTFTEQTRIAIGNRLKIAGKIVAGAATSLSITPSDLGLNYIESAQVTFGTNSASVSRVMSVQTGPNGIGIPGSVEANEVFWVEAIGY